MPNPNPIPAPTPEDMARDAAADLATCDAATPGPWERRDTFIGRDKYHSRTDLVGNLKTGWDGRPVASTPVCSLYSGFIWFEGDCSFIADARTALPAWIRRAAAAEAERDRLRAELDLWRPLTPDEAERAFQDAKADPLPEERIREIARRATDPAERIPNSEQAQLAATNARLAAEVAELEAALRPFADLGHEWERQNGAASDSGHWVHVTVRDCRHAAAVLAAK